MTAIHTLWKFFVVLPTCCLWQLTKRIENWQYHQLQKKNKIKIERRDIYFQEKKFTSRKQQIKNRFFRKKKLTTRNHECHRAKHIWPREHHWTGERDHCDHHRSWGGGWASSVRISRLNFLHSPRQCSDCVKHQYHGHLRSSSLAHANIEELLESQCWWVT